MFKTVRSEIAVFFSIVIVAICIMFGVSGYRILRDYLIGMQQQNQERLAGSLCSSLAFFREEGEADLKELLYDTELYKMVEKETDSEMNMLREKLSQYVAEHDKIRNIYIITSSYKIVSNTDSSQVRTYLIDRISTAERYEEKAVWDSGYNTSSMMLFGKMLPQTDEAAYVFLQIDNSEILELFSQFRFQNSQRFSVKGKTNGFEVTEQGFYYNYYDNYEELIHTEMSVGDWELKTWSDKTLILGPTKDMTQMLVCIMLVALFMGVCLSIWLAQWITRPIKNMKKSMLRYGEGDFSAKVEVKGKNEIAILGHLLNQMSGQISSLIQRIKAEENQRHRLELQTMIYQINPHFLYNTLDSVSILARQNKDIRVAEIVTDLSRLFRLGLHQGREIVTVRDELSHVMYYLKIQKMRFEDDLEWEIEGDPEVMQYMTMKFILQPIVENAIYHGIRAKGTPGNIKITVRETETELLFAVSDTGNGMNEAEVRILTERINRKIINEQQEQGFGLWNVNQRIKLFYGEDCGISIESVAGQGTKVFVRLYKTPNEISNYKNSRLEGW